MAAHFARRRRARTCLAFVVIAIACGGMVAGTAAAAELTTDTTWKPLRIGVLPIVSYSRGAEDLFAERPAVRRLRERAGEWQRRLEGRLAALDEVEVLTTERLRERLGALDGVQPTLGVARERASLGRERYRGLKLTQATADLQRADALYREAFGDVLAPEELASVAFYRGLARVDAGAPEQASGPFREMMLLDPGRTFQKGYYPEATETALKAAAGDLASQRGKALMGYPLERLTVLASKARVDALAVAFVDGPIERPHLQLIIFDGVTRGIALAEQIPLHGGDAGTAAAADEAAVDDRLDRALSTWHTCAIEAETAPRAFRPPRQASLYVDLGYSHTLFLGRPDNLQLFHSPGATIGLTYESPRNFLLFGRITQMVSLDDPMEDLRDEFLTTRIAVGAGLVGGSDRVRVFIQAGLEFAITATDISVESDAACKLFAYGDVPGRAAEAQDPCHKDGPRRLDAPGLSFGFDVSTGVRWIFTKGWYGQLTAGLTTYVIQGSTDLEMNFPFSVGAGIGNRF